MRFEVLTVVLMTVAIFWDITLHKLAPVFQREECTGFIFRVVQE
jgi:hypothetical protein